MVFSSLFFICVFLPMVLVLDWIVRPVAAKNALLVIESLLFYSFGELRALPLLLASVLVNWAFGLVVGRSEGATRKMLVVACVAVNLLTLAYFKYTSMLVTTVNGLFGLSLSAPEVRLPLGISFFTFQALSYVVDVYRGVDQPERNPLVVLLYICLFPQLVAGPIVKYHDISGQLRTRYASIEDKARGLRRFAMGLGKKVLIANVMGAAVDELFALDSTQLAAPVAWLAAFAYLMQIYYDFSGYSDMAIGIGAMLGFRFLENFDHPYAAASIRDFWRRWHISLSTWFKEYVYIPLGGNRRGRARTIGNKMTVFFLCGLWHGANWTFVVWGLAHGLLQLIEEMLPRRPQRGVLAHVYTIVALTLTFVVFRSETLGQAGAMIKAMLLGWKVDYAALAPAIRLLTPRFVVCLVCSCLLAAPLPALLRLLEEHGNTKALSEVGSYAASFIVLALCLVSLSSGSYNPFIYFRF